MRNNTSRERNTTAACKIRLCNQSNQMNGILSPQIATFLSPFLPPLQQESKTWSLLYSTNQHGISFKTLCSNSQKGPLLLLIRSFDDQVFGGFISEGIHLNSGYYGNGQCFLWKLNSTKHISVYPGNGDNEYYVLTLNSCFAMGGGSGKFGLWIDEQLSHGHTDSCETFNNDPLVKNRTFDIQCIETWEFII